MTKAAANPVIDTGEDMFAEDGPWVAIPANYNPEPYTAAELLAMADLDGDLTNITDDERAMMEVLSQVLIAAPDFAD